MAPSCLPSWTRSFYGLGTLQFRSAEDLVPKNRDITLHYALGLLGVHITHLEFLIQLVRDEARETVFLVCSQVELMMLVQRLLGEPPFHIGAA